VETFIASGKRDEANRLASRWTDESPEMPEPWLLWARLKSEQGDFTEAKRAIERVLSLDPSNEIAREYLAQIDLTTKTS
jgi:Tfp pilus assembly protein PilF